MASRFPSNEIMSPNLTHRCIFEDLPVDAIMCILRKLSIEDLLVVGTTCRALNAIANSDDIWMERCQRWKNEVELAEWRVWADSTKALYKVLRKFSEMVGAWMAKELAPRGGMLFITWEKFSLVACRVLPHSFEDVKFARLFDVIGMRDGSVKVELITVSRIKGNLLDVRVPGALVWSSSSKSEFHLEESLDDGTHSKASTSSASTSIEGQDVREESDISPLPRLEYVEGEDANLTLQLHQSLLLRGVPMGLDDQRAMSIPVDPLVVEQHGSLVGQWAGRFLMPFTSFGSRRPRILGEGNGVREARGRSPIRQSAFRILQIDEAKPEEELAGLWSGIYGSHGLEVIKVSYKENEIVATKILGDPNVPCDQITFKVSIATESTIISAELQQLVAMLPFSDNDNAANIIKVYNGHGRIAEHNFQNPQWVTGKLLVDENGLISFLWQDVDFVIRFRRLNLAALYRSHKALYKM